MEGEAPAQCGDRVFLKAALRSTAMISSQRITQKENSDFMSGSFRGDHSKMLPNKTSFSK